MPFLPNGCHRLDAQCLRREKTHMAINIRDFAVAGSSTIYDETDYWNQLCADIRNGTGSVLCAVPYVSNDGIERWVELIRYCVRAGRVVRIILQTPPYWKQRNDPNIPQYAKNKLGTFCELYEWLEKLSARVELRDGIHYKLLIIDDVILWEGSLNFLSHVATKEHVRRTVSWREVRIVKEKHNLGEGSGVVQDDVKQLRESISKRRKERRLSQRELAELIKAKHSTVSRIENGKGKLIPGMLSDALRALDLSLIAVPTHLVDQVVKVVETLDSPASASKK
jgi:hypothetical protein